MSSFSISPRQTLLFAFFTRLEFPKGSSRQPGPFAPRCRRNSHSRKGAPCSAALGTAGSPHGHPPAPPHQQQPRDARALAEGLLPVPCTPTAHPPYRGARSPPSARRNTEPFCSNPPPDRLKLLYRSNGEINSLPCFVRKQCFVWLKLRLKRGCWGQSVPSKLSPRQRALPSENT